MHSRRSPTVAANTRLARSGSSKICRTDVGVKPLGNEGNHIHQRFGGLPALRRQVRNFIQRQHAEPALGHGLLRVFSYVLVSVQSDSFASV